MTMLPGSHGADGPPLLPEVVVTLSQEGLEAWLGIKPPRPVPLAELEARLQQAGVIHGIDRERLRRLAESPSPVPELIATGTPPRAGAPARIEHIFQAAEGEDSAPATDDRARVDFHESHVAQVQQGQVLARKIPATEGVPGRAVTGDLIPAASGKDDVAFSLGKNVALSPDQLQVLAESSGLPVLEGDKLSVVPAFTVQDVDFSTGSIAFQGSVIIKGNVLAGFSVVATENIEVHGFVEGGSLRAVGSIQVRGGVRNKAVLEADRIEVRYVDTASTLKALGDIRVERDAVQSTLEAGGKISVGQRLTGGQASAGIQIEVGQLGHLSETPTHVEIQSAKAGKQPEELAAEISQLQGILVVVEERLQAARTDPRVALGKLIAQQIAMRLAIKQLELQLQAPHAQPQIVVRGDVHAGVVLAIQHERLPITSRLPGKTFKRSEEGLVY